MTYCKADIYFLADNTGSMGGAIDDVKAGASDILAALALVPDADFAYGVGNYKDFPIPASSPYAFLHQLAPTDDEDQVLNAIASWDADGGNDTPEGWLYALDQLARNLAGAIGWRTGAMRIIVQFGDAPSHDPIPTDVSGLPYVVTESLVSDELVAAKIILGAINVGSLNGPDTGGDYGTTSGPFGGQAVALADATGGLYVDDAPNVTEAIVNLILAITQGCDNKPRRSQAQLIGGG